MRYVEQGYTTQFQVDCNNNQMIPIINGVEIPSIGVALGPVTLQVSSKSQADLDCYRETLSIPTYTDLDYVFLDEPGPDQCSTYLSSSTAIVIGPTASAAVAATAISPAATS